MTGHGAWVDALILTALVLGALTTITTAIVKVPPLRWLFRGIARRVIQPAWRAVITEPTREWFQRELRTGLRPIVMKSTREAVGKAVGNAVPAAVRREFHNTVESKLEEIRTDVVQRTEAVRDELRDHMRGEEEHRSAEIEHRKIVTASQASSAERLRLIDERLERVERVVESPMEGTWSLRPTIDGHRDADSDDHHIE